MVRGSILIHGDAGSNFQEQNGLSTANLPVVFSEKSPPYTRIGAELGISEEAARAAAHRLRCRYRELLRAEVTRTVEDPADVAEEIRTLFSALGG